MAAAGGSDLGPLRKLVIIACRPCIFTGLAICVCAIASFARPTGPFVRGVPVARFRRGFRQRILAFTARFQVTEAPRRASSTNRKKHGMQIAMESLRRGSHRR